MKLALLIAYDGTGFRGWARQRGANVRTVQGVVEERLAHLLKTDVVTMGAGRTDAGVHAWGQVASFDAPDATDPAWLKARLNRWLAPEVVVRAAAVVPESFDARFSATRRTYEYTLYRSGVPSPFLEPFAVHVPVPLSVSLMRRAARAFVGEHDFASFCRGGEGPTTRRVRSIVIRPHADGRLVVRIAADSFCQQMVRSVVGTLVDAGVGKRAPEDVSRILAARDRAEAAPVAPAKGLVLMDVRYRRNPFPGGAAD